MLMVTSFAGRSAKAAASTAIDENLPAVPVAKSYMAIVHKPIMIVDGTLYIKE
jgi:hypothetical protein